MNPATLGALATAPRAAGLVTHCVYRIATGKWEPGARLPSVRAAEQAFGVDRRTVLAAYGRLEQLGLVRRVPRSGVFVRDGAAHGRLARHRHELERLFERFAAEVASETGLSSTGVFRYFAELAAIRARERPDCAFVECTRTQAEGHAREVERVLGTPCLALTTTALEGRRARVPTSVRTVLVSGFHLGELRALEDDLDLTLCAVPIEVDPGLARALPDGARRGVVLEPDAEEVHSIFEDVAALSLRPALSARAVQADDVAAALEGDPEAVFLLSPRLWGAVDPALRAHARVREVRFRVRPDAWAGVADAVGLPLGGLGGAAPEA